MTDTAATVAVLSAVVSLVATALGVWERRRAFQAQQRFNVVSLRKEFHLESLRYRMSSYPPVFEALGAVSDVSLRYEPEARVQLRNDPALLRESADALKQHLYGQAGLLMTMETRNVLHTARQTCLRYLSAEADQDDLLLELQDAYFHARRFLRADLDMVDDRSPEHLRELVDDASGRSARASWTPQSRG